MATASKNRETESINQYLFNGKYFQLRLCMN